jgi:hypothetical protein
MIIERVRIFRLLDREWERVRGRPWFRSQAESVFELERTRVFRLIQLTRKLSRGAFSQSKPHPVRYIQFDKLREIVELPLEDQLVQGLLRGWLSTALESKLSESVHSFRKGRSVETALRFILSAVAQYRAKTPKKERTLHVLRFDIKKCGESIPVHPNSRLWERLQGLLPEDSPLPRTTLLSLLTSAVRPEVILATGSGPFTWRYGTPTGSPLQPLVLNAYLSFLDDYFLKSGGIYCRYGDDFFFAHPDESVFNGVCDGLGSELRSLELEVRPEKVKIFRWSGSGFRGSASVEFLGMEIRFNGQTRLNSKKEARFRADLKHLVHKTFFELRDEDLSTRVQVCRSLMVQAYGAKLGWVHPYISKLLRVVDDRSQLQALDYEIARAIATAVTGNWSLGAFRKISPRMIRMEWKIPSLVRLRNRRGLNHD